jgi:hypothetical protein
MRSFKFCTSKKLRCLNENEINGYGADKGEEKYTKKFCSEIKKGKHHMEGLVVE